MENNWSLPEEYREDHNADKVAAHPDYTLDIQICNGCKKEFHIQKK